MNSVKRQYLTTVRSDSAYPVYRGVIGTITVLVYGLAGVIALGALVMFVSLIGDWTMLALLALVGGAMSAAIAFLLARLWREAALMLADLADATVDANSRG